MKTLLTLMMIALFAITSVAQDCHNYYPAVSPDGNYLYFKSDMSGTYLIYKANADGTNPQALLSGSENVGSFRLSADGTKIVFSIGAYGGDSEIYIMNSDGSDMTQLTSNSVWDGNPSFSPDGTKIVFDAWDTSNYPEIFTMMVDGTDRQQLTEVGGAYWQSEPVFNPGGDKIYFLEGLNADNHIVMMDTDGSNWVDITPENQFGYSDINVQFDADGSHIAFATSEWNGYNAGLDIVTSNADGSDWVRLTSDGQDHRTPFFHPNGNKIIFASDAYIGNYFWDIVSTDLDGSNRSTLYSCSDAGIEDGIEANSSMVCDPNPMTDEAIIRFEQKKDLQLELVLFDNLGKSCKVDYNQNSEGIILQRGNLSSGLYIFTISSEAELLGSGKLIVY